MYHALISINIWMVLSYHLSPANQSTIFLEFITDDKAVRHKDHGSWFIREFILATEAYAHIKHLEDIIPVVRLALAFLLPVMAALYGVIILKIDKSI